MLFQEFLFNVSQIIWPIISPVINVYESPEVAGSIPGILVFLSRINMQLVLPSQVRTVE